MVLKLKQQSQETALRVEKNKSEMETDENKKVRMWLNKITPDNYDSMQSQLRKLLFGDRKTKEEKDFEL